MLTSLRIRGFRCLRDVKVDLEPLTVLIGKNDTGKTSLLEAIRLLSRLVVWEGAVMRGSWPIARSLAPGAKEIVWDIGIGATPRNELPGPATYSLAIGKGGDGGPAVLGEACSVGGTEFSVTTDDSQALVKVGGRTIRNPIPMRGPALYQGSTGNEPHFHAVARALFSSRLYRFDPKELAGPSPIGADDAEPELRHDGAGLAAVLDYMLGVDRAAFDALEAELREVVPFVRNVLVKTAAAGPKRNAPGKAIWFAVEPGGHHIPAQLVSDGVLLFLAYLVLVHSPSSPATILLEEPENGVHPRRLKEVASFLERLTSPERGPRQTQVVLATHSPYLLDHVRPESVRVFGRDETGATTVRPALELPLVKERLESGFSLGEMWFNVGEDRLLSEEDERGQSVGASPAGE